MPAPENRLKTRLAKGEVTFGCWLGMADPYIAEMAAGAGFDWLLIDGEHAPNDIRTMSAQLAALRGAASSPILRLVDSNPATIKQALDIGAQSLLIPMIESLAEAQRTLAATRYAPQGFRGVGASLARASNFGSIPDYIQTANDQICLILQVENRAGLAALDDILTLQGVDGVFIGPADLAADMGHPGNSAHPEVRAEVLRALSRIKAAGKAAGVLAVDDKFIGDCLAAGASFVGVGVDVALYTGAMRGLARKWIKG